MRSFILPANGQVTPESVARRRKIAQELMTSGMDVSPVQSPWQAAGRIGQALVGGYSNYQADQQEAAGRKSAQEEMGKLLSGGGAPDNAAIMGAMNNPWATDIQGRMAGALLENNLKLAQPKDPIKMGEGDTLLSGDTYKPIYSGAPKVTDDIREYNFYVEQAQAAGETPMPFNEFMMAMKKAGASQTNIDMKGQTEYSKERGKGRAGMANDIDKSEQAAMQSITSLGAMENAMADPNFYSGFMAEGVQGAKRLAVALGGDPNQVAGSETFNSFAKQMAISSMGGSLGTGFSNADRDFVTGQVPTLANTPEGNKQLIQIHKKIAQRKIEIARMMRAYEDTHGQLDNGFLNELSAWAEKNPLFPAAIPADPDGARLKSKYGLE